jgi:3-methyladenine DNA glycosylase/8-oxoguanine DNA glycosylase
MSALRRHAEQRRGWQGGGVTTVERATSADASTVWRPTYPVDVHRTLSDLRHGGGDPCHQVGADGTLWRTSRMPSGPVTYRLTQLTSTEIAADAWGAGAAELIAGLPTLLGSGDSPETFDPRHPLIRDASRRLVGFRVPRTGRVVEALIPAVLEQKVIGLDATAAWRRLVTRHGEPAPGPAPDVMRVPPSAETWKALPSWEWHQAGVDGRRARTARVCATSADKLERAAASAPDDPAAVYRLLLALPGVGPWTAAQVGHRALGDADALPIGDYHLAALTGWALAGRTIAEDEVEEFYEPWRPHRYRVVRLLELTPGTQPPRRGPRLARQDYRRI